MRLHGTGAWRYTAGLQPPILKQRAETQLITRILINSLITPRGTRQPCREAPSAAARWNVRGGRGGPGRGSRSQWRPAAAAGGRGSRRRQSRAGARWGCGAAGRVGGRAMEAAAAAAAAAAPWPWALLCLAAAPLLAPGAAGEWRGAGGGSAGRRRRGDPARQHGAGARLAAGRAARGRPPGLGARGCVVGY